MGSSSIPQGVASALTPGLLQNILLLVCLWLHTLLFEYPSLNSPAFRAREEDGRVTFTVVVTTVGRSKLERQLTSLGFQLTAHDNIVLISDINATDPSTAPLIASVEGVFMKLDCNNCTKIFRQNPLPMGGSGHNSRTFHQKDLPGAFIMHADDDDMYTPDAFEIMRAVITTLEPRVYIFRAAKENLYQKVQVPYRQLMSFPAMHSIYPREIGLFNGGTPNGVVRNIPD